MHQGGGSAAYRSRKMATENSVSSLEVMGNPDKSTFNEVLVGGW